jgi:hypothetical protein
MLSDTICITELVSKLLLVLIPCLCYPHALLAFLAFPSV